MFCRKISIVFMAYICTVNTLSHLFADSQESSEQLITYDELQKDRRELKYAKSLIERENQSLESLLACMQEEVCDLDVIKSWYEGQQFFQNKYDDYTIKKHSFILIESHKMIKKIVSEYEGRYSDEVKRYEKVLQDYYNEWYPVRDMMARHTDERTDLLQQLGVETAPQKLQRQRKYAFDRYFDVAKLLAIAVNEQKIAEHSFWKKVLIKTIKVPFLMSGLAVGGLVYGITYRFTKSPLLNTALFLSRKLGKYMGPYDQVHVMGREHINMSDAEENEVQLLVPSHRSTVGDVVLLSHLQLANAFAFANTGSVSEVADNDLVMPLGHILSYAQDIAAVGPYRGLKGIRPYDKLMQALEQKRSKNIINFGQGFIPSMHEILSPTTRFTSRLIYTLLKNNYQVRIVPITLEVPSSFYKEGASYVGPKKVGVKIAAPIKSHMVAMLAAMELGDQKQWYQLINMMLRAHWFKDTVEYGELTLEEIDLRLQRVLKFGSILTVR